MGNSCLRISDIIGLNGNINENPDGSVSVYTPNQYGVMMPYYLTQACCLALNPNYTFDIETQTCRWAPAQSCLFNEPIDVVINSNGNDGSLFYLENQDECALSIDFNYLFKFKCDVLGNILFPSEKSSKKNNTKQLEIEELDVKIDFVTNEILNLSKLNSTTLYSINCLEFPSEIITPLKPTSKTPPLSNFDNTGFGSLAPLSFPKYSYSEKNFCLLEPSGLEAWATILGPVRYGKFLNGDSESYNCEDVINIYTQNKGDLIIECTTPFGSKTKLINDINELGLRLANYNQEKANIQLIINDDTTINKIAGCSSPVNVFETLDVSMNIEIVNQDNTLTQVYTHNLFPSIGGGNLYSYLNSHTQSGFYVCGDTLVNGIETCKPLALKNSNTTTCSSIVTNILEDLFSESGMSEDNYNTFINNINNNAFASEWLHYNTIINDPEVLGQIANKKIKLSFTINDACSDFCILLDNIVMDKVCSIIDNNDILLTKSPGFDLIRIRDNKKSWSDLAQREFIIANNNEKNPIRQTNYDVNDDRLIINSKEIDLDINIAGAIETDVWCYLSDNPCLLTGVTTCNPCAENCDKIFQDGECFTYQDDYTYEFQDSELNDENNPTMFNCCGDNNIDFSDLLTTNLSGITTIQGFEEVLTSELIDVKNRKTISSYSTLRAIYDRYINSSEYCSFISSGFDYKTIDNFTGLIGNYWVDIIEQVVPSTTIWGSVKIYTNTMFDEQKFKYKAYTSLLCKNSFYGQTVSSPINGTTGECVSVNVEMSHIPILPNGTIPRIIPIKPCGTLCIAQYNSGSEFIGTVSIIGQTPTPCSGENGVSVNECTLRTLIVNNGLTATATIYGGVGPYEYLWNTNETTQTINVASGQTYSCTVTDINNCCASTDNIII